ncbi:DUF4244 domain-containing protein [Schaalia vaccimaxillae]|uniref:DUF4244 domain-containing protein n=1 Tax=Schaalia vaccimaxillae TaxID=183916 RepID=UPI0003B50E81|nr:DUF4244 domain-containing protein [Schaalia vaccimaxillae]
MKIIDRIDQSAIHAQVAAAAALNRVEETASPRSQDSEEGSTTVEYAIGAVATAGLAGLLVVVLKSGAVKGLIQGIIESALSL